LDGTIRVLAEAVKNINNAKGNRREIGCHRGGAHVADQGTQSVARQEAGCVGASGAGAGGKRRSGAQDPRSASGAARGAAGGRVRADGASHRGAQAMAGGRTGRGSGRTHAVLHPVARRQAGRSQAGVRQTIAGRRGKSGAGVHAGVPAGRRLSGQAGGAETVARSGAALPAGGGGALDGGTTGAAGRRCRPGIVRGEAGAQPAARLGCGGLAGGAVAAEERAAAGAGDAAPLSGQPSGCARDTPAICPRIAGAETVQAGTRGVPASRARQSGQSRHGVRHRADLIAAERLPGGGGTAAEIAGCRQEGSGPGAVLPRPAERGEGERRRGDGLLPRGQGRRASLCGAVATPLFAEQARRIGGGARAPATDTRRQQPAARSVGADRGAVAARGAAPCGCLPGVAAGPGEVAQPSGSAL